MPFKGPTGIRDPYALSVLHHPIANPTIDENGKGGKTDFTVVTTLRAEKDSAEHRWLEVAEMAEALQR